MTIDAARIDDPFKHVPMAQSLGNYHDEMPSFAVSDGRLLLMSWNTDDVSPRGRHLTLWGESGGQLTALSTASLSFGTGHDLPWDMGRQFIRLGGDRYVLVMHSVNHAASSHKLWLITFSLAGDTITVEDQTSFAGGNGGGLFTDYRVDNGLRAGLLTDGKLVVVEPRHDNQYLDRHLHFNYFNWSGTTWTQGASTIMADPMLAHFPAGGGLHDFWHRDVEVQNTFGDVQILWGSAWPQDTDWNGDQQTLIAVDHSSGTPTVVASWLAPYAERNGSGLDQTAMWQDDDGNIQIRHCIEITHDQINGHWPQFLRSLHFDGTTFTAGSTLPFPAVRDSINDFPSRREFHIVGRDVYVTTVTAATGKGDGGVEYAGDYDDPAQRRGEFVFFEPVAGVLTEVDRLLATDMQLPAGVTQVHPSFTPTNTAFAAPTWAVPAPLTASAHVAWPVDGHASLFHEGSPAADSYYGYALARVSITPPAPPPSVPQGFRGQVEGVTVRFEGGLR